jgi:hypothetical protein
MPSTSGNGIKRDYAHVDSTTMWFVKDPEWFDVIVTDNMLGGYGAGRNGHCRCGISIPRKMGFTTSQVGDLVAQSV